MNKITGGPAFPVPSYVNASGETCESDPSGMTLRDYLAAHAPEVPGTFKAQYFPFQGPAMPSVYALDERDRKIAENWMHDPCYELAGHGDALAAFQAQYDAHQEAKAVHDIQSQINRIIAWRWYYADLMIKARP